MNLIYEKTITERLTALVKTAESLGKKIAYIELTYMEASALNLEQCAGWLVFAPGSGGFLTRFMGYEVRQARPASAFSESLVASNWPPLVTRC